MIEALTISSLLYFLGRLAGLIGFACLSFLIISGDSARFFDHYFGLDRIIKFQRKFSLFTAVFIILHPLLFIASSDSWSTYLIPDFSIIPFALGIIAFYIFIVIMIASQLYKLISHRIWQYLHILTYILFFFAFYHATNWGTLANQYPIVKYLHLAIATLIIVAIIYRSQYKIRRALAKKFFVKSIKQETHNTFSLILESQQAMKFQPGQFCFLRLEKKHLYARHPFTIASIPQNNQLQFTIKLEGRFTQAAQNLQIGEEVKVDGPFGKFTIRDYHKNLVFIAGGVGITPFMSMIRDQKQRRHHHQITLLYGSQTEQDIIFRQELASIQEPWLKVVHILSRQMNVKYPLENGYINQTIITKYVRDINDTHFYICGPSIMKNQIIKILRHLDVPKRQIYYEDFFW